MIQFNCPSCEKQFSLADDYAGKRVRCSGCKEVATVPSNIRTAPRPSPKAAPVRDDDDDEEERPARGRKEPEQRTTRDRPAPRRRNEDEDEDDRRRPVRRGRDEDDDEDDRRRPARRSRDEDDEEDYRKPKRIRKRGRGPWADCPACGAVDPAKVSYTWWGGFIGPLIINVVRCQECGTQYNGVHGDYNTRRILIYTFVPLIVVVPLAVCGGVLGAFK